jgi:predicted nucleotide-binding protein
MQVDPRAVFIIHGRDATAHNTLRSLLRNAGLRPIDWDEAVRATGSASPFILEVVRAGFRLAHACVVLLTLDEDVALCAEFRLQGDNEHDRGGRQARPNVLLEAGMALALFPDRTVIVEMPGHRRPSDLSGILTLSAEWDIENRQRLIDRLEGSGCVVGSRDYLTATL